MVAQPSKNLLLQKTTERRHIELFLELAGLRATIELGDLRENLSRGLQCAVVSQVHKDYTHNGVEELMTLLRPELHP